MECRSEKNVRRPDFSLPFEMTSRGKLRGIKSPEIKFFLSLAGSLRVFNFIESLKDSL